ncbi:MAG: hypothetical protein LBI42_02875 [Chitinispirillales bacterium]|jgi:acyl carrier protein|nr:hypothetical protein [Chitinispirillales bacterium]
MNMTNDQKLAFIERALNIEPDTLTQDTPLDTVAQWDSLSILNLQIELAAINADVQFSDLQSCNTAGEVCGVF